MSALQQKLLICIALWLFLPLSSYGHGGVAYEEDLCVINIDFLKAHFTIYQPETNGNEEFCEEIPSVSETVFVMEYQHDFLKEMPVDFRIIRDEQDFGIYARWEDVETIEDIDAVTAFYQPPVVRTEGAFTTNYAFTEGGTYIGIVTAKHPDNGRVYNAVFYFQVGGPDYGSLPWFFALAILLQCLYWLSNGGLKRLRQAKQNNNN
ncbi:MAG: hypothetical protein ACSHXZ_05190 [Gammaproteobacteria bacterium]